MPDAQMTGPASQISDAAPCARYSDTWFVVYTQALREGAVVRRIRDEGGTAWLPLEPPPRRKVERERLIRPLFPRYCFVRAYPWLVVRNAGGEEMARIITSPTTRRPLAMPLGAVEALMALCDPRGVMRLPEPRQVTRKDKVRIEDGPFAEFTGLVERTERDRVWVLLRIFGSEKPVPFTRDQVELIA